MGDIFFIFMGIIIEINNVVKRRFIYISPGKLQNNVTENNGI